MEFELGLRRQRGVCGCHNGKIQSLFSRLRGLCGVPVDFDDATNEAALLAPVTFRQCLGQSFGARPPGPQELWLIAQGAGGSVYMPKTDGTA